MVSQFVKKNKTKLEIYLRSGLKLTINNSKIDIDKLQEQMKSDGTIRFDTYNEIFVIRIEDIESFCLVKE